MGVHNLWELLAPVGRRVSVETLAGKRLAIDASIWMIQFMKAMRDDKGEMVKNAHILGFFRRICKLLFLRTKPVFVFDGATPALKRRTVIARRRQRENAKTKMRKTAEKLLLNQVKTMRLQELAENLEKQRQDNDAKGKRKIIDKVDKDTHTSEGTKGKRKIIDKVDKDTHTLEAFDEMLAASLAAEDNERYVPHASTSAAGISYEEEDDESDEEMILPTMHGKVDPAVLAALPPSMQLDLLSQMRERLMAENRQKYQKVKKAPEKFSELQVQAYLKTVAFRRDIDEVRKSAAGRGIGGIQASRIASEANREFIFSSSYNGDKESLASAGLDQNSNEQRQIPTAPALNISDRSVPTKKSSASDSKADLSSNAIHDDVETYMDESGRVRVSRVRAMGLRMTRDLQRNLDLMKETELESLDVAAKTRNKTMLDESIAVVSEDISCNGQPLESSDHVDDIVAQNRDGKFINTSGTSIEVSFDDNGENRDDDDDLFTRLAAGDAVLDVCSNKILLNKQFSNSDSDCEWEEGVREDTNNTLHHEAESENIESQNTNLKLKEKLSDGRMYASSCPSDYKEHDESDVEWEDGSSDIPRHTFSCQPIHKEILSKGAIEEEINFQEAIKRSLDDSICEKYAVATSEDEKLVIDQELDKAGSPFECSHQVTQCVVPKVSAENVIQTPDCQVPGGAQRLNDLGKLDISKTNNAPLILSEPSIHVDFDDVALLGNREGRNNQIIQPNFGQNGSGSGTHSAQSEHVNLVIPTEEKGNNIVIPTEQIGVDLYDSKVLLDSSQIDQVHSGDSCTDISSHIPDLVPPDVCLGLGKNQQFELKTAAAEYLTNAEEFTESSVKESIFNNTSQSLAEGYNDAVMKGGEDYIPYSVVMDPFMEQVEKAKANLDKEMQNLGKERTVLGDEHKRLERNAEGVSSEMFTECQELLQMFGLPYIIAPMEAEAQCAFMELENLVDGVVTDDSDVLLFGARSVYKNIFDDRKYVETYFMKDIENELGLTREKLIRMALLLGSDYTEGVSGIGIVNAIEVINAFPEEDGLRQFREWIESPDPSILGKLDSQERSNMAKTSKDEDCSRMKQQFMDKHRKVSKNWHIPSIFPSEAVISAYVTPQVDKSTETFTWGKPDLFVLRKLCWEKFGWGTQKADELLVPVLKEYNKHETQLRMEAFYTFNERFAKIRSKRIQKAVKGTMENKSSELLLNDRSKSRKRKKVSQAGSEEKISNKTNAEEAATKKRSRKRRTQGEPCETGNSELSMQEVRRQHTNRGSKSRGGGRSRGRGRGRSAKQGRWKESSALESAEISSSDEHENDSLLDKQDENHGGSHQVRRSTRPRKAVKYTVNDLDSDDLAIASQDSGGSAEEGKQEPLKNIGTDTTVASQLKHHSKDEFNSTTDQVDMDQIGYAHSNADEDYLKMGGGFCFTEDDIDKETGQNTNSSTTDVLDGNDGPSIRSVFMEDTENEIRYNASQSVSSMRSVDELQTEENTDKPYTVEQVIPDVTNTGHEDHAHVPPSKKIVEGHDPGSRSGRFLSAMPNLRRKRKS